ncbi:PREDICTED: putative late blight resistance protein homolog R1B-11 [Erythranthe guttata]|uniref:putative late blight resistance protein homolog R1B-11 n=1 Tax=Erythranthe guttata TaxID=4155 RepID=UPI00064D9FA6|nr:PREDICTED: putative late blight resistance protein homolog R1B-11 [Erythranthe guttata]|eukprot:XP_012839443.1 PREDICTED: putative late blight resistance protein homolog R1B-11 [Erythranthe guttata]
MGVFPEDKNIRVSWLVKVWVCEGFMKSISGKSLEAAAREYLEDLCDRNLILVHQRGLNGGIKFCKIHDLVRELCLREAEKEKFIYVRRPHDLNIPQGIINTRRRITIHQSASEKDYLPQARHALECMPLARSLIVGRQGVLPSLNYFRLLRVLNAVDKYLNDHVFSLEAVFQLVNSRFIAITSDRDQNADFPSSINLLWNLQTLIVKERDAFASSEIWKMTQLRHVQFNQLEMPDPPLAEPGRCFAQFHPPEFAQEVDFAQDQSILGRHEDKDRFVTQSSSPQTEVTWNGGRQRAPTFHALEQLDLRHLDRLEEIPSDIGERPTLQSIRVQYCSKTVVIYAKRILDEQEEFDNVGLRVRVVARNIKDFESLASPNFQVEVIWMN